MRVTVEVVRLRLWGLGFCQCSLEGSTPGFAVSRFYTLPYRMYRGSIGSCKAVILAIITTAAS